MAGVTAPEHLTRGPNGAQMRLRSAVSLRAVADHCAAPRGRFAAILVSLSSKSASQSPDVCEKPEFMLIFTSCEIHIFFTLGLNFTKCEITLVIFTHGEFHHEFTLLVKFSICECCEIHREFTARDRYPTFHILSK